MMVVIRHILSACSALLGWISCEWLKLRLKRNCTFFLVAGFLGFLDQARAETTNYFVHGVIKEIRQDERQVVIAHEEIPGFMNAMTMPFKVRDAAIFKTVTAGESISFQLHVTEDESWVDQVSAREQTGVAVGNVSNGSKSERAAPIKTNYIPVARSANPLRAFKFTNEIGRAVSLSDFRGQAIALTFFFTRCPIPEFCPRLSRNFQEVEHQLSAMQNAPTNWHLLSVTFDPEHDTPEVLKAYGTTYGYDPAHWSFLTGPKDKIAELARFCDVKYEPDNGSFNHNVRTLIIDPSNRLQMVFPTSGNLSGSIAQELLKAMSETNRIENAVSYTSSESKK